MKHLSKTPKEQVTDLRKKKYINMNAKMFVDEWNAFLSVGLNENNVEMIDRMRVRKKKNVTSYKDEVSSLINNYDMEGLEIGVFTFLDGYSVTENYLLFAKIEMDLVGFDRKTREVVLLDHDNIDHVMIKCAKNSITFLTFLSIYSKYSASKLLGDNKYLLPQKEVLYEIVGGDDYQEFVNFCIDS